MPEKLYKMSEIARLHGITKKTLCYYEKINLFKPDFISGSNNYKYYTRKNFPILKQIILLKNIGFSLLEIKELLDNRTHELMIKKLEVRKKEVSLQLKTITKTMKSINYLIKSNTKAMSITENDLNRPSIQIMTKRKVYNIITEEHSKEGVMLAYRRILNHLKNHDIISHRLYGTVYFNNYPEIQCKTGAFIGLPSFFEINKEVDLPGGKYICMFHKGTYYNMRPVEFLLKWLKENNYTPIGDFYDYCIIDRTFTKNEDELIMELQVMVK